MRNIILILFLLSFLTGCDEKIFNHKETVNRYYSAFDLGNYNEIKSFMHDSLTLVNGDFETAYNHESFYEFFKWDSVFKPSYQILEIAQKNNKILVTVTQKNLRNAFLKNNPLKFKSNISFISGKISKIEEIESIDTNWQIWQKERDSLVNWVKINHPDLDGFVNDMTMTGATNYLQAIELYTSNQNSLKFK